MKRLMSLVVAGGIAASLVMLAGPASAAGTARVYFAQGLPAKTVDVCIDGAEVRSDMTYRKKLVTDIDVTITPTHTFSVYTANAATCGGTLLASHMYTLVADKNYTAIAGIGSGSHLPRMFLFSNSLQNTPPHTARFSYRHAADIGAVNAALIGKKIWRNIPNGGSVTMVFEEGAYQLRSRAAGSPTDLHPVRHLTFSPRIAYQVYLVGDHANGYSTITIQQPVIRPVH
jgi:hypothetical protein